MCKQFDSYNDSNVATSQGGDCTGDCQPFLQLTYTTGASDVAPQVNSQYPPNNYNSPTLTPELIASATDTDSWPDARCSTSSRVYNSVGHPGGHLRRRSPSGDWTVPAGDLAWGQTYYWTVQAYDGAWDRRRHRRRTTSPRRCRSRW